MNLQLQKPADSWLIYKHYFLNCSPLEAREQNSIDGAEVTLSGQPLNFSRKIAKNYSICPTPDHNDRCARARPGTGATRWWRAGGASASTMRTAPAHRAATTSGARTPARGTPAASAQTAGQGTTPLSALARRVLWAILSSLAVSPGGVRTGKCISRERRRNFNLVNDR